MMEALRSVVNPTLPYSLPVRLHPGHVVYIEGRVPKDSEGFTVNLCGRNAVALKADLRFDAKPLAGSRCLLTLNAKINATWGQEEQRTGLPLFREVDFQLSISIKEEGYQVMCNDSSVVHFAHRFELHWVDRLVLNPTAYIFKLRILAPLGTNTIKYGSDIVGGLFPGKTIVIDGCVPPKAKRFALNLLQCRTGNVALQVNPRFDDEDDGEVVVRNARINGRWGEEERFCRVPFPFAQGQAFLLEVICEEAHFVVKVNHAVVFTFTHRIKALASITCFFVYGDVSVH